MATCVWVSKQKKQAQVNTVTPANVAIGNVFTVTVNSKAYSFTATAGTVANVTAGLYALLAAATAGDVSEITWADGTTALTATATTAGKPFTQTSSATGGTATLVTSATTANLSPSDINDAANWSGGAVPGSNDDVYFDATNTTDALWNLSALSAVTLTSLNISNGYTGSIGLSPVDTDGTAYWQYRAQYLLVGATTSNIGDTTGTGSGRLKIDNSSIQTTLNVNNTGSPTDADLSALIWKGTHASNVVNLAGGSFGAAVFGGETATIATLRLGGTGAGGALPATAICGPGVTLTTVNNLGGSVTINSAATTILIQNGGTLTTLGTGAITTVNNRNGTLNAQSNGTITTLVVGTGSTADFSGDARAKTVTTTTIYAGATVNDPENVVVWTNGLVLANCRVADCQLDFGANRTITPV